MSSLTAVDGVAILGGSCLRFGTHHLYQSRTGATLVASTSLENSVAPLLKLGCYLSCWRGLKHPKISLYQKGTLMRGTNYDELDLLQLNIYIVDVSPIETTVHRPIPQSTDDTDSGFRFKIGLVSTAPAHSDTDIPQMIAAPITLPCALMPGPAVLAPATTPAVRRRRQQSVDEDDIVEGSRQRKQSKRACAIPHLLRIPPDLCCCSHPPRTSPHSADDVGERVEEPKKGLGRCYRMKSRITHQNEAALLPRAPDSHLPYGSMPWRKHRGVSAAQGHGGEGTQAEMCRGWRGKGRHGDGQSHKAAAHQSHSLPKSHCGGQNNGIHHQKWDWMGTPETLESGFDSAQLVELDSSRSI
ncbi:hypothetical protein DFH08DRAFT_823387 [Mycena albidolilacea]|uniref:Uncharacterized protein n=1 Tax=Mycena albidolilacea TaxID=1033008 RepID=A0AAD6Z6N8_9AGAR|nr:hypothetical protein DFH08DRAFT_823387 [Mycena albidolilacea]